MSSGHLLLGKLGVKESEPPHRLSYIVILHMLLIKHLLYL